MTRKDYKLIADAIRKATPVALNEKELPLLRQAHANTALRIADALGAENARFDREKFLLACGVEG